MNNKTAIHYQVDIFKSISRKHEEWFHSGIYVDSRKSFSDRLDAKLHVDIAMPSYYVLSVGKKMV